MQRFALHDLLHKNRDLSFSWIDPSRLGLTKSVPLEYFAHNSVCALLIPSGSILFSASNQGQPKRVLEESSQMLFF